jgi:hypothetical protein
VLGFDGSITITYRAVIMRNRDAHFTNVLEDVRQLARSRAVQLLVGGALIETQEALRGRE